VNGTSANSLPVVLNARRPVARTQADGENIRSRISLAPARAVGILYLLLSPGVVLVSLTGAVFWLALKDGSSMTL